MFRFFARSVAINLASIYIVVRILSNVFVIEGGAGKFLLAALCISIINLLIRPIINLFLLPINLVTMGVFRWVANLVTLYLTTKLVHEVSIHPYDFPGIHTAFLIIPPIHFSAFGSFIIVTLCLTAVFHILYWLFQE